MIGAEQGAAGTLRLAPHPTSPSAARRHVAQVLEDGPLADLVETTSLLVSEVVTNAVLHAATDIELSCSVVAGSVCVEVRDRSMVTPSPRHYDATAMTGRGLGMVELLADEWGVDADEGGKTVWFVIAGPDADPAAPRPEPVSAPPPRQFDVHLLNLPVALLIATVQYGDAVLRELVLLSIAASGGDSGRPTSKIDLGPLLGRLEQAHQDGQDSIDLVIGFPEDAVEGALERLALVDEADRVARDGELLTPPAVPEVGVCRRWLYSQIALQADGAAPVPWAMPEPGEPALPAATLTEEQIARLDALSQGAVVADDGNRILYANERAARLLGWSAGELTGRRLVTIVPPEQRAAHLAGFTRYLLTGEARILGQRMRLPALRRDGSTAEIDLTIEMIELGGGRLGFHAVLEEPRH